MSDDSANRRAIVSLSIAVEGGLIVLAVLLGWLLDKQPFLMFHWNVADALWGIAAAVPMWVLFFVMLRWPVGPLRQIKQFSQEIIRPLFAPCTVIDLLGISVLAGLGEEMLFRGVLQGYLAERVAAWLAVVLAALLFGLLHAITATYTVLAALLGIYLGWIYLASDNLLAVALTHALYDFVALLYLVRGPGAAAGKNAGEDADIGTKNAR
jgi:membrane protease YdiL (CAAX protease family)